GLTADIYRECKADAAVFADHQRPIRADDPPRRGEEAELRADRVQASFGSRRHPVHRRGLLPHVERLQDEGHVRIIDQIEEVVELSIKEGADDQKFRQWAEQSADQVIQALRSGKLKPKFEDKDEPPEKKDWSKSGGVPNES